MIIFVQIILMDFILIFIISIVELALLTLFQKTSVQITMDNLLIVRTVQQNIIPYIKLIGLALDALARKYANVVKLSLVGVPLAPTTGFTALKIPSVVQAFALGMCVVVGLVDG